MTANDVNTTDLSQTYHNAGDAFSALFNEMSKIIVGQKETIKQIVIAILCNGHTLVESNPGLGKTLTISTISKAMDLNFSRIQCTPDLMPADITGTHIIEERGGTKEFKFEPGPIFANPRLNPLCLKQCRKSRLLWEMTLSFWTNRSFCLQLRILLKWKEHSHFRRHNLTGSY